MHICFVCREYIPSLRGGGIASYIYNMANILKNHGHKITIIAASDNTKDYSYKIESGINVIRLDKGDFIIKGIEKDCFYKKFRVLYRFISYRKRIIKEIQKINDIDIIEVADFGAESLFFDRLNIPYIIRLHNPSLFDSNTLDVKKFDIKYIPFYWQARKEICLIKKAKYISSCSNGMKNWILEHITNIQAKINVIYNPIKLSYSKSDSPSNIKPFIFYAGTISEWKGCEDLIKASINLKVKGWDFNLLMAGKEGEYADYLKNKYSKENWIHFLGKLDHDILFSYYKNAKVVCFPSWWDNMPMVCIEAMMCGAIVIGSTSGGMKEIISDNIDGFHVQRKNINDLENKIEYCFNLTDNERYNISKNAKKKIKEKFSDEIIYQQMIKYYQEVIEDFKKHESTIR